LTLFAPTVTGTQAEGMVDLDFVLSVNADIANELEVVNLSNWTYTAHGPRRCPPGLAKKGPGHPGWENVCSPFLIRPRFDRGRSLGFGGAAR
jgi:hypothetical protein